MTLEGAYVLAISKAAVVTVVAAAVWPLGRMCMKFFESV